MKGLITDMILPNDFFRPPSGDSWYCKWVIHYIDGGETKYKRTTRDGPWEFVWRKGPRIGTQL
jgi:hypothetical protein